MSATLPDLPVGTLLSGKFRIDGVIGAGGMGSVYRGTHLTVRREVAIKTLHRKHADDALALGRFQQEARIAGDIGHDNICEVIDFGEDCVDGQNICYIVMPLLHGESFGDMLESSSRISLPIVVDIICQTLLGVQAAHEHKIVHRDLKPDNIFVTQVGDRSNFVKLLDFGISKYMDSEGALELTRTGITLGTPLYMPPEQARGAKYIDHRADIYSIGVVLYEALVGTRPYEGHSFNEILVKICTSEYPRPRELCPAIPPVFEDIILKAMSRDPNNRFTTAREMYNALQSALHGLPDNAMHAINQSPLQLTRRKQKHGSPDTGVDTLSDTGTADGKRPLSPGLVIALAALALTLIILAAFAWHLQDPQKIPIIPLSAPTGAPPPLVPAAASTTPGSGQIPVDNLPEVILPAADDTVEIEKNDTPAQTKPATHRKRADATTSAPPEDTSASPAKPSAGTKRHIERYVDDVFD